jgi:hypothetical protein
MGGRDLAECADAIGFTNRTPPHGPIPTGPVAEAMLNRNGTGRARQGCDGALVLCKNKGGEGLAYELV